MATSQRIALPTMKIGGPLRIRCLCHGGLLNGYGICWVNGGAVNTTASPVSKLVTEKPSITIRRGLPSLTRAISRFKIEDEPSFQNRVGSRELLSWACIRLDRLRCGYRFVDLLDPKGNPVPDGKLLIKVDKVER